MFLGDRGDDSGVHHHGTADLYYYLAGTQNGMKMLSKRQPPQQGDFHGMALVVVAISSSTLRNRASPLRTPPCLPLHRVCAKLITGRKLKCLEKVPHLRW